MNMKALCHHSQKSHQPNFIHLVGEHNLSIMEIEFFLIQ